MGQIWSKFQSTDKTQSCQNLGESESLLFLINHGILWLSIFKQLIRWGYYDWIPFIWGFFFQTQLTHLESSCFRSRQRSWVWLLAPTPCQQQRRLVMTIIGGWQIPPNGKFGKMPFKGGDGCLGVDMSIIGFSYASLKGDRWQLACRPLRNRPASTAFSSFWTWGHGWLPP